MHCRIWSRLLPLCLVAVLGCKLTNDDLIDYRTIVADAHYDTEKAEEEHAKAIEIIENHLACEACWRVENETAEENLYRLVDCRLACLHANLPKAEEHLQKSLVADVSFGPAHNTLGTIYYWQRQLYLAAWEYEYAHKLMPERSEPLYNLGMLYDSIERLDEAIVHYEMALSLDPQNPAILGNLARALLRSGEPVDVVRPFLEEMVFFDTRPEWIEWAAEQLGLNPVQCVEAVCVVGEETEEETGTPESGPTLPNPIPLPPQPGALPESRPVERWPKKGGEVDEDRPDIRPEPDPTFSRADDGGVVRITSSRKQKQDSVAEGRRDRPTSRNRFRRLFRSLLPQNTDSAERTVPSGRVKLESVGEPDASEPKASERPQTSEQESEIPWLRSSETEEQKSSEIPWLRR